MFLSPEAGNLLVKKRKINIKIHNSRLVIPVFGYLSLPMTFGSECNQRA